MDKKRRGVRELLLKVSANRAMATSLLAAVIAIASSVLAIAIDSPTDLALIAIAVVAMAGAGAGLALWATNGEVKGPDVGRH